MEAEDEESVDPDEEPETYLAIIKHSNKRVPPYEGKQGTSQGHSPRNKGGERVSRDNYLSLEKHVMKSPNT